MNLKSFYEVSSAAIDDIMEHGFDSQERLEKWVTLLASSAQSALAPSGVIERLVRGQLDRTFKREMANLVKVHSGVSQFTLANIKSELRAELQRRILASAGLIKLNREASVARTLQRFAGWASSVPAGGTDLQKRREVKAQVKRGISGLPFEERRVVIDQGHKLSASINEIVATAGGAIAAIWHHVKRGPPSYESRPEHVKRAREAKLFLVRDSWAHKDGLVKAGAAGYTDDVVQPAVEVFCSCWWEFVYALRDLPADMLTAKGKEAMKATQLRRTA